MSIYKYIIKTFHKLKSTSLLSPRGGAEPRRARLGVGLWLGVGLLLLLASCARMGRPDGGWYDETPPRVIATSPADGGTNASAKKIHIYFDEFVQIENATEKVVVSPPQMEQAEIKARGKQIEVELKDSLKPNTTYTVDFSDAISDNNEGNPLGNYTYSFSTGPHIDTLQVSGCVLEAATLEPVKGTLVGLYGASDDDSCFIKKPMLRVARTDSRGRFVIRGIAPGSYRIYALQDQDGDYRFSQKAEQIAFQDAVITPSVTDAMRQDTTWTDSLHIKDIARVGYTRFIPDDIVLRAFSMPLTDRFFLKAERTEADHFTLFFSYGDTRLPELHALDFDDSDAYIVQPSVRRDTITYWLRDTALVNRDTLNIQLSYMATDTLGQLVPQTDTLQILSKQTYARRMKDLQKQREQWQKKQDRLRRRGEPYDSIMPQPLLRPRIEAGSIDPDRNVAVTFDRPLAVADTSKIHLYAKRDTLWYDTPIRFGPTVQRIPGDTASTGGTPSLLDYELRAAWKPDTEYSLEIDSMAFRDIYGTISPAIKEGIKVKSMDEYSSIVFSIPPTAGQHVIVELLNQQGEPVKRAQLIDGTAQFYYVTPGTYYARLFADDNNNGIWDTGDYDARRQPERLYYYPDEIECKAKWDVTLSWTPDARPLDQQKPSKIVKQKAETQKKVQRRNAERARKLGITYIPKM